MTFRFICQMRCNGCGFVLEQSVEGKPAYNNPAFSMVKRLAAERGWKQIGKAPDRTHAYYCETCCAQKPEVIAKIAARRLQGKEINAP